MSSLTHPRGPEPERTYWIRRGIALAAVVAALAVLVWVASMLFGSKKGTAGPVATPNSSTLAQNMPTPTPTPSPSASTSPTPGASKSPSASASSPAVPIMCKGTDIGVDLTADSSVKSGASTTLAVKFTNNSSAACKVNFGANPLTIKIYSGSDRIWSTEDCRAWAPRGTTNPLKAGASWTFSEPWQTKRSASGCAVKSTYLQPGTYVATASIAGGASNSQVIRLHA